MSWGSSLSAKDSIQLRGGRSRIILIGGIIPCLKRWQTEWSLSSCGCRNNRQQRNVIRDVEQSKPDLHTRRRVIGLRWCGKVTWTCRGLSCWRALRGVMSVWTLTWMGRSWCIRGRGGKRLDRRISPSTRGILLAQILSRRPLLVAWPGRIFHLVVWICVLHCHISIAGKPSSMGGANG